VVFVIFVAFVRVISVPLYSPTDKPGRDYPPTTGLQIFVIFAVFVIFVCGGLQ
jgi:hypothetical protein